LLLVGATTRTCGLSQHCFDFDGDVDSVADHHAAALWGHVGVIPKSG
jgi:hypothetical protein